MSQNTITKGQRITNTDLEVFYSQMTSSIPTYCYQGYPLTQAYTLLNEFMAYQNNDFSDPNDCIPNASKSS